MLAGLRLGPGLISTSPLSNIKKILYSHLTDNKYIQATNNIAKAENLTPFGTLGFNRKKRSTA